MRNTIKLLGIAAIIAVIGFSFTACGDDGGGGNPPGGNNGGGGGSGGTWRAVANSPFGESKINAIAYGGGKFVAGGASGKMAYSSDGLNWTVVDTSSTFGTRSINTITYANNKFFAGGDTGKMAYSTDGINWTAVTTTAFDYSVYGSSTLGKAGINGIAWGGAAGQGKFVALLHGAHASASNIAYSPDGLNWTAVSNTTWSNTIAWGSGKFVKGSAVGLLYYSSDGISWTKVADEDNPFGIYSIYAIAYEGGKFVAGDEGGHMATSPDGVTWTAVTNSTFGTSDIRAIAYGGGKFVAVGDNGKTAYSADGATWTAITSTAFDYQLVYQNQTYTVQYDIEAIAYGGGKFVVGGEDGRMWYSSGL
jgi:hypothetical protein